MRLVPESSPLPRLVVLVLGGLGLGGLAAIRRLPQSVLDLVHCPLRDATGLPCPTCGGTHAAMALAAGRFAEAWRANPLVTACTVGGACWVLCAAAATLLPAWRRDLILSPAEKTTARALGVLAVVLGWAWLLWQAAA